MPRPSTKTPEQREWMAEFRDMMVGMGMARSTGVVWSSALVRRFSDPETRAALVALLKRMPVR